MIVECLFCDKVIDTEKQAVLNENGEWEYVCECGASFTIDMNWKEPEDL